MPTLIKFSKTDFKLYNFFGMAHTLHDSKGTPLKDLTTAPDKLFTTTLVKEPTGWYTTTNPDVPSKISEETFKKLSSSFKKMYTKEFQTNTKEVEQNINFIEFTPSFYAGVDDVKIFCTKQPIKTCRVLNRYSDLVVDFFETAYTGGTVFVPKRTQAGHPYRNGEGHYKPSYPKTVDTLRIPDELIPTFHANTLEDLNSQLKEYYQFITEGALTQ